MTLLKFICFSQIVSQDKLELKKLIAELPEVTYDFMICNHKIKYLKDKEISIERLMKLHVSTTLRVMVLLHFF